MPEGDTIHRAARGLERALLGRAVVSFRTPRDPRAEIRAGTRVRRVEARGKHLLIHFDDGRTLRTHLRMSGSWHLYRPGEPWRRAASRARVVLEVEGAVAVCFDAPIVNLIDASRDPVLASLGPDLTAPDPDLDEVLRRVQALDPATPIGVALLDQRVAAGIGNVYRSEVAFLCGIDPRRPVGELSVDERRELYVTAARLLALNLTTRRRTTGAWGLAVYRRAGRPCPRCGTRIESGRLGEQARTVYRCPSCQR